MLCQSSWRLQYVILILYGRMIIWKMIIELECDILINPLIWSWHLIKNLSLLVRDFTKNTGGWLGPFSQLTSFLSSDWFRTPRAEWHSTFKSTKNQPEVRGSIFFSSSAWLVKKLNRDRRARYGGVMSFLREFIDPILITSRSNADCYWWLTFLIRGFLILRLQKKMSENESWKLFWFICWVSLKNR